MLDKVLRDGVSLPASIFAIDITGNTVEATGLVWECGDADHLCFPVADSLHAAPWRGPSAADLLLTMSTPSDASFFGEPRALAQRMIAALAALGLTPQVAFELEFYLLPRRDGASVAPDTLSAPGDIQVYDLDSIDAYGPFFSLLESTCAKYGLPLEAIVSENAHGQFEVNLHYQKNALRAADDAWFLKRVVKGVAASCGYTATFMAKPYAQDAGSGQHVHVSLVDEAGDNVFSRSPEHLHHALAGLLQMLPESVALFAPHANSYRRFQEGSYAPTLACWGENNRTAALRIPRSEADARRIEHRFAGADANPYLVLAAVLAGILHGLRERLPAPSAISGNAYANGVASSDRGTMLPRDWQSALDFLLTGSHLAAMFGDPFIHLYTTVKRHELQTLQSNYHPLEYQWYFERS
ncbi:glutamine synthetase family protein [Acidithiobacillus sp. AMEEHan]|uniref:glutamine synthetase family protein n=1 Tax=Acidithiobacillus sp. AMEEHan TaxID=2994951 RepID=UPI0027E4D0D4|nr:glutamine synthetase family protein [Acidithiobacillus sp. AMEEHan]